MKAEIIEQRANIPKTERKRFHSVEEGLEILRQAAKARDEKVSQLGFDPAIKGGEMTIEQLKEFIIPEKDSPFFTFEEGWEIFKLWREERRKP